MLPPLSLTAVVEGTEAIRSEQQQISVLVDTLYYWGGGNWDPLDSPPPPHHQCVHRRPKVCQHVETSAGQVQYRPGALLALLIRYPLSTHLFASKNFLCGLCKCLRSRVVFIGLPLFPSRTFPVPANFQPSLRCRILSRERHDGSFWSSQSAMTVVAAIVNQEGVTGVDGGDIS